MKYYCVMHNVNYTDDDIKNMIHPVNIKHHYAPSTYWDPGEDYINCDPELDDSFYNVVKIAEFYFYSNDNPFAVVIDGMTYCFNEKDGWEEVLETLGWIFFKNFDMKENEYQAKQELQDWIEEVCNDEAWRMVEEG